MQIKKGFSQQTGPCLKAKPKYPGYSYSEQQELINFEQVMWPLDSALQHILFIYIYIHVLK